MEGASGFAWTTTRGSIRHRNPGGCHAHGTTGLYSHRTDDRRRGYCRDRDHCRAQLSGADPQGKAGRSRAGHRRHPVAPGALAGGQLQLRDPGPAHRQRRQYRCLQQWPEVLHRQRQQQQRHRLHHHRDTQGRPAQRPQVRELHLDPRHRGACDGRHGSQGRQHRRRRLLLAPVIHATTR